MKAKRLYKYPVTYEGKEYTVTLKYKEAYHYSSNVYVLPDPEHYIVKIYFGEKKWYSKCLFEKCIYLKEEKYELCGDRKIPIQYPRSLTYQQIIEKAFKSYKKVLDKEDQENKELKEFKEWDGVIKC